MPNGLFTPQLITEVAEAAEDSVITAEELGSIISVITSIFAGVMLAVFTTMLIRGVVKGFTKETGIKTKEVAGVPIPVYS